jgi:tRNA pseudouridine55 synthase
MKNQPINQEIIPIWQPIGHSTHIIAKKVSEKLGVKTSHTGTLDPMAEGVIIVLAGETRHKKYDYAAWEKEYEFEIAFGVETDTFDSLGLITTTQIDNRCEFTQENVNKVLKTFEGYYAQTVPPYSAIKVKGRPLHWYARNNKLKEVDLPTREGEIYHLELTHQNKITTDKMAETIITKIDKVEGDLRQTEVIDNWRHFAKNAFCRTYNIAGFSVKISKGMYIRALSQEICDKLNTVGFIYSLKRTSNGKYNYQNSYKLSQLLD